MTTPSCSRPSRSWRFTAVSLALVATLGLLASACGDDTDDSSKSTSKPRQTTTTEAKSGGSGSTETTASTPTVTLPFDKGVDQLRSKIDDAKGDLCELLGVFSEDINIEDPHTPDQVKAAVDVFSEMFTAVGDAAESAVMP